MRGKAIRYSKAELTWIEANKQVPRRDLFIAFQARFDRPDVTQVNLTSLCKRNGWLTGRTGHFIKGQESHNKGQRGVHYPGSEKTWFRKGTPPDNRRPLYSERLSKDGYIEMKVPERDPYTGARTRFIHKHRYLWEKAYGPVPEGYALKCKDGDKTNTEPSNWEAVPRAILPRLNGRFGRNYDAAPAELRPTIMATAKLEHAARELKKGTPR